MVKIIFFQQIDRFLLNFTKSLFFKENFFTNFLPIFSCFDSKLQPCSFVNVYNYKVGFMPVKFQNKLNLFSHLELLSDRSIILIKLV